MSARSALSPSRSSSSRSSASASPLRRLFKRRRRRPADATRSSALRELRRQRRERRLVDSWSLPELYVLRGLVHLAVHKAPLVLNDAVSKTAARRRSREDQNGHAGHLKKGQPYDAAYVEFLLTRSKRFFFRSGADERLEIEKRSALARLFPMLAGVSRQVQRQAFALLDRGKLHRISFSALCATLARCRLRPQDESGEATAAVYQQAEVVFEWFQDKRNARDELSASEIALMEATVKELVARNRRLAARMGTTDVATLAARLLQQQQPSARRSAVSRELFCRVMATEFPHLVQVLLAPFDIVSPAMNEGATFLEYQSATWTEGDTAYLVDAHWWTQWVRYVQVRVFTGFASESKTLQPPRVDLSNPAGSNGAGHSNGAKQTSSTAVRDSGINESTSGARECVGRPGPITNTRLCVSEQESYTLKPGLATEEFVPVPYTVWQRLELIYGGGPALPRRVIQVTQDDEDEEQPEDELKGGEHVARRHAKDERASTGSTEEPATSAETRNTSEESDTIGGGAGLHHFSHLSRASKQQCVRIDLYPLVLQIRVARHDSRRVHLLFSRLVLIDPATSVQGLMQLLGIVPGVNGHEISLWVRREKFKSWRRVECSFDTSSAVSQAALGDVGFRDAFEVLIDFRPISMDEDPASEDQSRWRRAVAAMEAAKIGMLDIPVYQSTGNDFVTSESALRRFRSTGNWNALRDGSLDDDDDSRDSDDEPRSHPTSFALKFLPRFDRAIDGKLRQESRLIAYDGVRATGLVNLGNTCFMNSALQCIGHSPVFREYFLSHRFEDDINKRNPLGSRGLVTVAYSRLVQALWRERDMSYFIPNKFREEFIKFRHHFEETRQYDSHEFMVSLLDSLHEDLNRAGNRSNGSSDRHHSSSSRFGGCFGQLDAVVSNDLTVGDNSIASGSDDADDAEGLSPDETIGDSSWLAHRQRNDSVVVDLFHGQLRSVTVCGTCGERKVTFDPSLFFSLPIPEAKFVRVEVKIVLQVRWRGRDESSPDAANEQRGARALVSAFWLERGSCVTDLCDRIASANNHQAGNRFIVVEVRRNRIKRVIDGDELVENVAGSSSLYAYERAWTLEEIPTVPSALIDPCLVDNQSRHEAKRLASIRRTTVSSFDKLIVGSRIDAIGPRDDWHAGTVIEVVQNRVLKLASSDPTRRDLMRAVNCKQVCVHFDALSSKWNKWFTPGDWNEGRMLPLYSRTKQVSEVFEVQVVHRYVSQRAAAARRSSPSVRVRMQGKLAGSKMSLLSKRSLFEIPTRERTDTLEGRQHQAFEVFGMPLFVTVASNKSALDMHKAILLQVSRFLRLSGDTARLAELFKCARGPHRMNSGRDNNDEESDNGDDADDEDACARAWAARLPYVVRVVNLEDVGSSSGVELPVDVSNLLQHFSTRSVLTLDWKDYKLYAGRDNQVADDYPAAMVEALRDAQEGMPAASNSVPIAKCMDALLKQETISVEDHWICERCGVPRAGTRTSDIWRLPDLVMIQLKRFQYLENQHKQKVRALVDFPLVGLDFSRWVAPEAAAATATASASVYDLYAVANHVGGLTRGHYTACCRYDADFSESAHLFTGRDDCNVQMRDLWLRFDDEKVSEVAAGDVVTDAAYVLFYKRRAMSPSNVLQYAL